MVLRRKDWGTLISRKGIYLFDSSRIDNRATSDSAKIGMALDTRNWSAMGLMQAALSKSSESLPLVDTSRSLDAESKNPQNHSFRSIRKCARAKLRLQQCNCRIAFRLMFLTSSKRMSHWTFVQSRSFAHDNHNSTELFNFISRMDEL